MSPVVPSGEPPRVFPGEPGVEIDAVPPFVGEDPACRWLFSLNRFGIRPGLERIEALLAGLGRPERHLRTIVIAGTNGKGSTTRALAALLQAAGYRVGCFTSPHLLRVYERLEIGGVPCQPERFAAKVEMLRPLVETVGASWFETLTALAVQVCHEERVDFLCCEAGLGGRLDATNALPATATLLTSVALDHQKILGQTLAEIAAQKLGLVKPGAPLFASPPMELRAQVLSAAAAVGSRAYLLDDVCHIALHEETWDLETPRRWHRGLPAVGLPVLRRNLALALLCVDELSAAGVVGEVPDAAAVFGQLFLPGRFQRVLYDPEWRFDTAHNTEALVHALSGFLEPPRRGRRLLLFGLLREKEIGDEVAALVRQFDEIVVAPLALPRSRNRDELAGLMSAWGLIGPESTAIDVAPDVGAALARLGRASTADRILVTGSCFLVAEALYRLGFRDLGQTRQPWPAASMLRALDRHH